MKQIKISRLLLFFGLVCLYACNGKKASPAQENGPEEKPGTAGKWEILFDGTSTAKWRSVHNDSFPSGKWVIDSGALVLAAPGGGDIMTRESFTDFELAFDFKLTYGANSGVKYFVSSLKDTVSGTTGINGPEYQLIDDNNHPAVKNHLHEEGSTAALYLLYAPENKKLFPAGEWNQGKIIAKGNDVEHWLNGARVVSYTRGNDDFHKRVGATKFKNYPGYGESPGGPILLTDHEDKVYFRNIRIKRL